jgi:hypothetical protein
VFLKHQPEGRRPVRLPCWTARGDAPVAGSPIVVIGGID